MLKPLAICTFFVVGSLAFPSRIVNGTNAYSGEFPSIVSLQYSGGEHSCGGSILDPTHILTAAHCIYGMPGNNFIQYGTLDIEDSINRIKVIKSVYHEDYQNDGEYSNDVAVLTLEEPIIFSDTVQPTVLPEQGEPTPEHAPSVLAGWGFENSGGEVQRYLQRVDLKIYSDDDCERLHHYIPNRQYNLCSGITEGGKGQCSGDSGGPLFAYGKQVGLVSWSVKPCAHQGYPGVFTKVSTFIDWIDNQIGK